jgi:hypothetical protein
MGKTAKVNEINKTVNKSTKSPFSEMTILTQRIEKENKNIILFDKFHIRPNSINTVTDKVNINPKNYTITGKNFGVKTESISNQVVDYLDRCFQVPKEKYPYPISENQEYGWYHNYKQVKPFCKYGIQQSEETNFDDNYCKLNGFSQFSNKAKKKDL